MVSTRIVLAAAVVAACGTSQALALTAHTPARARPQQRPLAVTDVCLDTQLTLADDGVQGATGHAEISFGLVNRSGRTCALRGYPGVRLLGTSGRALTLDVKRGGGFFPDTLRPPTTIEIAPRASARFGLSFITDDEYAHAGACRTVSVATVMAPGAAARWLSITLPGQPRVAPCGEQAAVSPVYSPSRG